MTVLTVVLTSASPDFSLVCSILPPLDWGLILRREALIRVKFSEALVYLGLTRVRVRFKGVMVDWYIPP